MLPNFFVLGAQKAGTTALQNYLRSHPDIFLPTIKETKFFIDDKRYVKGLPYYVTEHFSTWHGEKAIGEIDPDYMYFEQALERMAVNLNLQATKLIFVLRNPIDRAFSHYLMTVRRGVEKLSFEDGIRIESERVSKDYFSKMHFSYTSRGFYLPQIQRFLQYTDNINMLFILSDDLKRNTMDVLKSCYRFLGVEDVIVPPDLDVQHHVATAPRSKRLLQLIIRESLAKKLIRMLIPSDRVRKEFRKKMLEMNQTSGHGLVMQEDTRRMLANIYREHNSQLAEFIGRDLSHWDYPLPKKKTSV